LLTNLDYEQALDSFRTITPHQLFPTPTIGYHDLFPNNKSTTTNYRI